MSFNINSTFITFHHNLQQNPLPRISIFEVLFLETDSNLAGLFYNGGTIISLRSSSKLCLTYNTLEIFILHSSIHLLLVHLRLERNWPFKKPKLMKEFQVSSGNCEYKINRVITNSELGPRVGTCN